MYDFAHSTVFLLWLSPRILSYSFVAEDAFSSDLTFCHALFCSHQHHHLHHVGHHEWRANQPPVPHRLAQESQSMLPIMNIGKPSYYASLKSPQIRSFTVSALLPRSSLTHPMQGFSATMALMQWRPESIHPSDLVVCRTRWIWAASLSAFLLHGVSVNLSTSVGPFSFSPLQSSSKCSLVYVVARIISHRCLA